MSDSIIVIPCYNEAARLDTRAFREFCDSADVRLLFVDDGSTDDTRQVIEALRQLCPEGVSLMPLSRNAGKAEAVRLGLIAACAEHPAYVGFWDADLATPLNEILAFRCLLETRPEIEMIFGSRVKLLGRYVERRPVRHYLGRAFATAAAAVLGIGVYDTQCGAKMFRVTPGFVERLNEPFVGGWIFDVEMIAREIQARRARSLAPVSTVIYEYPLMQWRDVAGSKIRARDWLRVGFDLGRIWLRYVAGAPRGPGQR
jgi:glycosyltransferase involved in cell wall biosynthesis